MDIIRGVKFLYDGHSWCVYFTTNGGLHVEGMVLWMLHLQEEEIGKLGAVISNGTNHRREAGVDDSCQEDVLNEGLVV